MEKCTGAKILHRILDMGELMLSTGAEIKRVENTVIRLGKAFGAERVDVFAITSSIVVTMTFPEEKEITQTRRIEKPAGTNLNKLEQLNALSRACCEKKMSLEELEAGMERIKSKDVSRWYIYTGSVISAAAFSVFFGGTIWDGAAAGVFALFLCFCQNHLDHLCPNKVIFNLLCSLVSGIGIYVLTAAIPALQADKIIIGDIMLLIPGIAMTNAVKDMLVGDTIAGTMRFLESLLWAGALAGGFMASMWITGSAMSETQTMGGIWVMVVQILTAFAGSVGFCMLFKLRAGLVIPASVGGLLCWSIYLACVHQLEGIFLPSFIASAFAAMYAEILARKLKAPATLFLIPAVVPLVPGGGLYYTISYAVQGDLVMSGMYGTQTAQFVLGIACGMCIIWALFTTIRPRVN